MAQVAIVIVVIAILATVIIAGVTGITKNAEDNVESQQEIAETMMSDIKHAFPTILSENLTNGLSIEEGQYEVYELGGYSIKGKGAGSGIYPVYNKGTLYISGNGTLDENSAIDGNYPISSTVDNGYIAIKNYGKLFLNDLVIKGGGNRYSNREYYIYCHENSETTLDNVRYITGAGGFSVSKGATLTIKGTNSSVKWIKPVGQDNGVTSLYLFIIRGTVDIYDGTFDMGKNGNTYAWVNGGTLTIENGTFKQSEASVRYGFLFNGTANGKVTIKDGFFDCSASRTFFQFDVPGTVTILGGEFVNTPSLVGGTGTIVITGGAFQWNPDAYVDDESGAYTITKTSGYLCRDGQTRTMYVVTKN